ncbi:SHOCT domain-containing protein [Marmoricola sp. URHB0036]|uniref:SHOCT domain-containing protein n=1 Tax=Marmoricola sp. URHB0036 TaxID=1298863 RepID=UPI000482F791|nr:SHOCT domain-containing protein [Marmoricola sp. URHB0036]
MPGLLRGVARTAVIAGTASAVNGRVQRRQANKFAEQDAQTYAKQQEAYEQQYAPPPQAPPPPPQGSGGDMLEQLKTLGELKAAGVLTEEEFAAQKAKILAR